MAESTLEITVKLTPGDGTTQETSGTYTFPTQDEAEDMYWAVMGSLVGTSQGERDTKRGKGGKSR